MFSLFKSIWNTNNFKIRKAYAEKKIHKEENKLDEKNNLSKRLLKSFIKKEVNVKLKNQDGYGKKCCHPLSFCKSKLEIMGCEFSYHDETRYINEIIDELNEEDGKYNYRVITLNKTGDYYDDKIYLVVACEKN